MTELAVFSRAVAKQQGLILLHSVDYQHEVYKGKLTTVVNLET